MTEIAIHPKRVAHVPRRKALGKSGREPYHKQRPRRAARAPATASGTYTCSRPDLTSSAGLAASAAQAASPSARSVHHRSALTPASGARHSTRVERIEQALATTRMFRNLTPEQVKALADAGENVEFPDGRIMMIEGTPADSFFLIRDGFVALQTQSPAGPITIETLHAGDPVGWSWLFEPYLVHFDARSRGVTRAIRFDAAALRRRCEEDSDLHHELMCSLASVIVERLNATRLQLLDVYGRADWSSSRSRPALGTTTRAAPRCQPLGARAPLTPGPSRRATGSAL